MSGYSWAALGLLLAGAAAWAIDVIYGDRIRHAITARKFRRELDHLHPAETARVENQIAEIKRRMRECSGEEGDPW